MATRRAVGSCAELPLGRIADRGTTLLWRAIAEVAPRVTAHGARAQSWGPREAPDYSMRFADVSHARVRRFHASPRSQLRTLVVLPPQGSLGILHALSVSPST